MTLTLAIENVERLANGAPRELVLHRRGAVVGRAATGDWPLPDPTRHVSSRHFEVRYAGSGYTLVDSSTNGTTLLATGERLAGPHAITDGDRFQVGPYVIVARLTGEARAAPPSSDPAAMPAWSGWDAGDPPPAAPPPSSGGWDTPAAPVRAPDARWQPDIAPSLARPEPHRAAAGWDAGPPAHPTPAASSGWVPSAAAPPLPTSSAWQAAVPAPDPASAWSSAAADRPAAPSPDDLWGRIAEGNVVDWARGGFGQPTPPPADPLGLDPAPAAAALPPERPAPPAPRPDPDATQRDLLLKRLVAGLVVMVEARARAKAQLGAEATAFSPGGHNPLKFARTPDEALQMLLAPPAPGFLPADCAIEDAFRELQTHQVATLRAMQGALRATLERFSPSAIRARAEARGLVERLVPAARDAALWQAYEREFGGVAQGSDEAFLDMFAKEFRSAYNVHAKGGPV